MPGIVLEERGEGGKEGRGTFSLYRLCYRILGVVGVGGGGGGGGGGVVVVVVEEEVENNKGMQKHTTHSKTNACAHDVLFSSF